MSRRLEVVFIAFALTTLSGCGDDESPGFRDCIEWKTTGNRKPLQGTLHQSFSGWIEGAQHVVSSPADDYRPHGYVVATNEDPVVALGVAGCALDAEGNLWRLSTHFGIRKDATAPVPVSTCEATAWSSSAPLRLTASVTFVPPITAFNDSPTVIDVDATFPEP